MDKKSKIAGGITGLVIGDILGFPLKSLDFHVRQKFFPINNLVEPFNLEELINLGIYRNDIKNRIYSWFPAGYYSFYSQQALLVVDSLYHVGDFDIEDISQRLVKYSFPRDRTAPLGVFRGYTRLFYDSIQNIANGLPLKVCGVTNCIGDGPLKAIPVGLFYGFETKSVRDKSIEVTLLTNRQMHSLAASAAIAYVISQTSNKTFFNVDEEIRAVIDFTRQTEEFVTKRFSDFLNDADQNRHTMSNFLNELYNLKNLSIEDGMNTIKHYAHQNNVPSNSPEIIAILSLFMFIKYIGNFEQVMKATLEQDIDIEIVAPIVGALSGSLLGFDKIPNQWKTLIKNEEEIKTVAANLYKSEEKVEKPKIRNYYIKEIEHSNEQQRLREEALTKLDELQAVKN